MWLLQWYLRPSVIALMGGLLPFGSIFIEVYYILTGKYDEQEALCPAATASCMICHQLVLLEALQMSS